MTTGGSTPRNAASAFGQDIGKLFEHAIIAGLQQEVERHNHTVRPETLQNGTGNAYQIDAVVFTPAGEPVIIIDPKYIRYSKHNRDKGSWLCVAHYNLRKTFPTIRKSIAVLAGRWSQPSKALIHSFGVEVLEVDFTHMVNVLGAHGIEFDWPERDGGVIARPGLTRFRSLSGLERSQIGDELIAGVIGDLRNAIVQVLEADMKSLPSRVSHVEVLLKTDRGEMMLRTYDSISDSIRGMVDLVADLGDISALLQREND